MTEAPEERSLHIRFWITADAHATMLVAKRIFEEYELDFATFKDKYSDCLVKNVCPKPKEKNISRNQ